MTGSVTPEAAEFLTRMLEEPRLPTGWDVSGVWLDHAQQLAQFLANHHRRIPHGEGERLIRLGCVLIEMVKREIEAATEGGCWLGAERKA